MATNGREITRKRILKAALDISDKVDYESATIRQIARAANVSQASIYAYFPGKEQLLVAMAHEKLKELVAELKSHDSHVNGTLNRLRVFTWNYLRFHEMNPKISWVIYMSTNVLHWFGNAELWRLTNELGHALRNILIEGQAEGEVRDDINLRFVSHQYFGGLRFIVVNWLLSDGKWSITADTDSFAETTFNAVKTGDLQYFAVKCPLMQGSESNKR